MCVRAVRRHQGTEKDVKEGEKRGKDRKRVKVGGERSDIQCDLCVVMKSAPQTNIFHLYIPAEFGV